MAKEIFRFKLPIDHPDFSGHDDLPEAYRVIEDECAVSGVVIQAKWDGHWESNPWNTRTLVRNLVAELNLANHYLGELLAVLHRDGGHFVAEHGFKKSVEVALKIASNAVVK